MSFKAASTAAPGGGVKSAFEQQRKVLLGEIATNFEQVLANINKLNRSLEAVLAVGNEFSAVEALWSHFENVMSHGNADDGESPETAGPKA